ncbi:MAG: site-2 protease family protein [Actinomycetota bacterium]
MRVPLGRVLGVRLAAHPSWLLILSLVVYAVYTDFAREESQLSQLSLVGFGAGTALLFFACLVSHELAHAVVARRLGVPVRGITLFLLGGVAEITREVRVARDEFAIALIGPTVSVLLGGLFALTAVTAAGTPFERAAGTLAVANGAVGAFNLVPGLPLDGGRLLRSALWAATGNYRTATRIGSAAGRVIALGLLVAGAAVLLAGSFVGVWYLLLAWFLDESARRAGTLTAPSGSQRSTRRTARRPG